MVSGKVKVKCDRNLDMQDCNRFTAAMSDFKSSVTIKRNGREINAKSIMNLMSANIKDGDILEFICKGSDELAALDKATCLIGG